MAGICGFFKALLGICETKALSSELWSVEGGKVVGIVSARSAMDPALEEFVSEARRRKHYRDKS